MKKEKKIIILNGEVKQKEILILVLKQKKILVLTL